MATQWVDFKAVRAHVSLEQVLFEFYSDIENLARRGSKLVGPCPVHGGSSARAFHAELDRDIWHCFSRCQGGGNQLDFVARREGISVREAALRLQARFMREKEAHGPVRARGGTPEPDRGAPSPNGGSSRGTKQAEDPDDHVGATAIPNPPLNLKLNLKHDHPHLTQERALQLSTLEHFGVGWCGRGIMRGCIAIPVQDELGSLIAYAGRRLRPADIREHGKYKFPRGFRKELVLYNLHSAKQHAETNGLVLVEGFFSVLQLYEAGIHNVVASMGCELSDAQVQRLVEVRPADVIVLFDGNRAGQLGAQRASAKLLSAGLLPRVIHLPDGTEPDDLPPRLARWLINGTHQLGLASVSFELPLEPDG